MAKLIAVMGEKGGTGKSTLSHLIGHGCGSLPHPIDCAVITTDPGDMPITGSRRYLPVDGREPADLTRALTALDQRDRLLIVLDGAAARVHVDKVAADLADLIVIPFGPSYQDAQRAARDMARLPKAVALPNNWPTHPAVAARAKQFLDMLPADRRLPPVPKLPRTDELLSPDAYGRIATALSRPAQALVLELLYRLGVHPVELAAQQAG
jgi:chromosome partitioning protein